MANELVPETRVLTSEWEHMPLSLLLVLRVKVGQVGRRSDDLLACTLAVRETGKTSI